MDTYWQWQQNQVLSADLESSIGAISPAVNLYGQQKHCRKADKLILASGGSEHE